MIRTLTNKVRYIWFFTVMRLLWILPDLKVIMRIRGILVKPSFKSTGRNFQICSTVMVINPHNVSVGNDVYLADNVWIQGAGGVTIKDEVMLGPRTIISSSNHLLEKNSYRFSPSIYIPVSIGKGSWTGAGVTILAGVQIGDATLCSAGSVITKSVPNNVVVGGVPAKRIK